MKPIRTLSFVVLALVMLEQTTSAKIWIVNNNVQQFRNFSTIQQAHDSTAVANGDTLSVIASPTGYPGATLLKRLVIIGSGYFLAENPNPPSNTQTSNVAGLTFSSGTVVINGVNTPSTSAGSTVVGIVNTELFTVNTNNVSLRRVYCSKYVIFGDNVNGGLLSQSYVNGGVFFRSITQISNVTISNCFLAGNTDYYVGETIGGVFQTYQPTIAFPNANCSNIIIANNVIFQGGANSGVAMNPKSSILSLQVYNNIIRGGSISANNTIFSYNILYAGVAITSFTNSNSASNLLGGTQLAAANGNQQNLNVNDGTVFVSPTGASTDGKWQLSASSFGKGAGLTGSDIGMYGGGTPYVRSGIPEQPTIQSIFVPGIGTTTLPNVKVTIRGRN